MILVIVTNIFFKTSQTACSETATRAASFAVRAFNYHARKLTVRPTPGQTFCKAPWEVPMVSDDPAVRSAMHLVRRAVELKAILIPPIIISTYRTSRFYYPATSRATPATQRRNCPALESTAKTEDWAQQFRKKEKRQIKSS